MPFHATALALLAATPAPAPAPSDLLERVVDVLEHRYYDDEFRRAVLPELAATYRERARGARGLRAERELVHELLSHIPVSHLGLLSEASYRALFAELARQDQWMFGFQLVELPEGWFVDWVYEGGPADRAGLERGDEVLSLDGIAPAASPRVDWRTDDAALADPALHALLAREGDAVEILLRRRAGRVGRLRLPAGRTSGWRATRHSARVIDAGEWRIGYVHYWFVPLSGAGSYLRELCVGRFAGCDALILDLRGRGGAAHEAWAMLKALDPEGGVWDRPVVALVHADSRSAKEVIAYELAERGWATLVGETTAGAVIPATFEPVGSDSVLMFPSMTLGEHTDRIEGRGVAPDVAVDYPLPWSEGRDPILEAGLAAARARCEERARAAESAR